MSGPFDLSSIPPASKVIHQLDIAPTTEGTILSLPVLIATGAAAGPTIVVLAGVHGDEYEGMAAIRAVYARLDPATMRGRFIAVPVCNPQAFAAKSRTNPVDGLNLARTFPGRVDGTISEQIAFRLTDSILSQADFLLDLHSSGSYMAMPLLVGFFQGDNEQSRISREAAERFGVDLIWAHETVAAGRSITPAHERGIPWLYTESPSGGWLQHDFANAYAMGTENVMRYLGILPGIATVTADLREIAGEGDTDKSMTVPVAGFLMPVVDMLDQVEAGDLLGRVEDLAGNTLAELHAPTSGMVVLRRNTPVVAAGDLAFLLT